MDSLEGSSDGTPIPRRNSNGRDDLFLSELLFWIGLAVVIVLLVRLFGKPSQSAAPVAALGKVAAAFSPWFPVR
jgi:hypothetical protein